jgi:hypothetical protein
LGTLVFPSSGNQRLRYTIRFALPPSLFLPSSHSPQSAVALSTSPLFLIFVSHPRTSPLAFSQFSFRVYSVEFVSSIEFGVWLSVFHPLVRCFIHPLQFHLKTLAATPLQNPNLEGLTSNSHNFCIRTWNRVSFFWNQVKLNFPSNSDLLILVGPKLESLNSLWNIEISDLKLNFSFSTHLLVFL